MLCLRILHRLKAVFAVALLATIALLHYSLFHSTGRGERTTLVAAVNSTLLGLPTFSTHRLLQGGASQTERDLTNTPPHDSERSSHQAGTSVLFRDKLATRLHSTSDALTRAEGTNHTVAPVQLHTEPNSNVSRGFVVVLKIYEQQTMASGNLLQLQCWAQYLRLVVVKPFMFDSCLRTPLDESKHRTMMTMEDMFDMQDWSSHAASRGYSPLVEWGEFIEQAPRSVILVQIKYPVLSAVRAIRAQGKPFPRPPQAEFYRTGCKFRFIGTSNGQFLKSHGFKIVRQVCLNFNLGDELTLSQIRTEILGGFDPANVSVIIDEWRGLGENQRVLIREEICREKPPYREETKPSQRLVRDAETYISSFLNSEDYLAVITRFEMTALTRRVYVKSDDTHAIIPYCLKLTLQTVEKTLKELELNRTFLSIDIGKYGSASFAQKKYYGHLQDMTRFVSDIHNGATDLTSLERTFEQASSWPDKGYIATLQQLVVTRAKCIVFVGGGSFQRRTLTLYRRLHPDPAEQCIRVISKCTSPSRPIT